MEEITINTETYLNQIKRYEYMIEDKLEEIEKLRDLCTSMTVSTEKENIKSSGSQDKLADAVAKIVDIQNDICKLVDELIKKRCLIINQIDSLGNTTEYRVLTNRYVLGLKIEQIADKMGYSLRQIKRLKVKALQNFENVYGNEYKNL